MQGGGGRVQEVGDEKVGNGIPKVTGTERHYKMLGNILQ